MEEKQKTAPSDAIISGREKKKKTWTGVSRENSQ